MFGKHCLKFFAEYVAIDCFEFFNSLNVRCKYRCDRDFLVFHAFCFTFRVHCNDKLSFNFCRIIFVRTKPCIKGKGENSLVFCVWISALEEVIKSICKGIDDTKSKETFGYKAYYEKGFGVIRKLCLNGFDVVISTAKKWKSNRYCDPFVIL